MRQSTALVLVAVTLCALSLCAVAEAQNGTNPLAPTKEIVTPAQQARRAALKAVKALKKSVTALAEKVQKHRTFHRIALKRAAAASEDMDDVANQIEFVDDLKSRAKKTLEASQAEVKAALTRLRQAEDDHKSTVTKLEKAEAALKEAKRVAACDDYPCANGKYVCVPLEGPEAIAPYRKCVHACSPTLFKKTCADDEVCRAFNHTASCKPACRKRHCRDQELRTRCKASNHTAFCVDPCTDKDISGTSKCGQLACRPTIVNKDRYKCVNLCRANSCPKGQSCSMSYGGVKCTDVCQGVKLERDQRCVRLATKKFPFAKSAIRHVCDFGVGVNICAKKQSRNRCVPHPTIANRHKCVHPCFNVECKLGERCVRKVTNSTESKCVPLCSHINFPCPPKTTFKPSTNPNVSTSSDNLFQCKPDVENKKATCVNPCADNPCPEDKTCHVLKPTTDKARMRLRIENNKFHVCRDPCARPGVCTTKPLTRCVVTKHEQTCQPGCDDAAERVCKQKAKLEKVKHLGCIPRTPTDGDKSTFICVNKCELKACHKNKYATKCTVAAAGFAKCFNPCKKGLHSCNDTQVCVPNGSIAVKRYECKDVCTVYPCKNPNAKCTPNAAAGPLRRRCVVPPPATPKPTAAPTPKPAAPVTNTTVAPTPAKL